MRTTLTLDPDVATRLEEVREARGETFKALVNRALRLGLREIERPSGPREPYELRSTSLGGCRLPDLDDVSDAIALGEGEGFR
jgi:hypothetical protein